MNSSETRIDFLTREEIARFFQAINRGRDKILFQLMYRFALRVSEARQIFIKDINLKEDRIRIYRLKGSASQEYPLPKDIKTLLTNYIEKLPRSQIYLFLSREGNPLSRNQVFHLYQKYFENSKLGNHRTSNPRTLRHSFAIHAFQSGQDRNYVQMMLGIKNPHCVLHYEKSLLQAAGYSQTITRGGLIQLIPGAMVQCGLKKQ